MDLVIKRNQNLQEKLIKRVLNIDTAFINTFKNTSYNTNKTKCFVSCKAGNCVSSRIREENNVTDSTCRKEYIARDKFKNRAYPLDSADFLMEIPEKIYKAYSMTLSEISLPTQIYNISPDLYNNYFRIYNEQNNYNKFETFEIPPGMYNINTLIEVINKAIGKSQLNPNNITFKYNDTIDKIYIIKNHPNKDIIDFSHHGQCETMDFNTTLGWLLGFRMPAYSTEEDAGGLYYQKVIEQNELNGLWPNQKIENSIMPQIGGELIEGIVAEGSPSLKSEYLYLIIDEYNRNKNNEHVTLLNNHSNIIAKIPLITLDTKIVIDNEKFYEINRTRTYFSPVNIEKVNIKLIDRFGRKIDIGINTINLTLEFDCVYT